MEFSSRSRFGVVSVGEQVSLGFYTDYADAQRTVDFLADHDFEVETTQIIGSDLRMVEQVTGRLTWARALLSGAVGGVWFGLFVGVLFSLLTLTTFGRAMVFGMSWGLVFGVLVDAAHAQRATTVLAGMSW